MRIADVGEAGPSLEEEEGGNRNGLFKRNHVGGCVGVCVCVARRLRLTTGTPRCPWGEGHLGVNTCVHW
jgi:hypothetical protein